MFPRLRRMTLKTIKGNDASRPCCRSDIFQDVTRAMRKKCAKNLGKS